MTLLMKVGLKGGNNVNGISQNCELIGKPQMDSSKMKQISDKQLRAPLNHINVTRATQVYQSMQCKNQQRTRQWLEALIEKRSSKQLSTQDPGKDKCVGEATPERNDVLGYQALQDLGQSHCHVDYIHGQGKSRRSRCQWEVGTVVNGRGFGSLSTTVTKNSTKKAGQGGLEPELIQKILQDQHITLSL